MYAVLLLLSIHFSPYTKISIGTVTAVGTVNCVVGIVKVTNFIYDAK